MRTFISFVVLSVLICGVAASAEQTQPATEEQILQELRELRKAVADLKAEVAALQARMVEKTQLPEASWTFWTWESSAWGSEADLEALSQIKPPDNPTREQAREYVWRVLAASRGQQVSSSTDPQIEMLAQVGPDHLDVLLEACGWGTLSDTYLLPAIRQLAGPQHKGLILEELPRVPTLVEVVVAQGWQDDAKETLVDGLRHNRYLPGAWVSAVVSFQDPNTYDELIHYFVYGSDRPDTYRAIKDLPGIELADAVSEAWHRSSVDAWEAVNMAPVAIEWGDLDALDYAVSDLTGHLSHELLGLWTAVLQHTDAPRSLDGLERWFEENKDKLVFDPETRKFRAKGGE